MPRRFPIAGVLCLALASGATSAASTQSSAHNAGMRSSANGHALEIASIQRRFLATTDHLLRSHLLGELRLAAREPADADALNAAVSAMLPAAASAAQAEELLALATASPATQADSTSNTARAPSSAEPRLQDPDRQFLLDARLAAQAAPQAQGDVEALADLRIDRLQKDSHRSVLARSHVQQLWRINTAQGAKAFATRTLMYAGMSERLCLLRAQVLQRDGAALPALVSADQPVEDRNSSMYFDSRTRDLRFPRLQPGDLVEIEYLLVPIEPAAPVSAEADPWAGYYAHLDLFRDSYPTLLRRRVLIAPSSIKLYAVEHGLAPAVVRSTSGETTRVWEMRDVAAVSAEALSPGASSLGPYLHVSTIGSMQQFGRWYSALLEPAMQLDPNLRELARQIRLRNLTPEARVQAVYESVQRNTRYLGFEFGVHSYQPYPLATVDRRGFGDCKDKAAMIVALLRAVGVDAEFAMVRTRSAGEVAPDAYSVQLFNHALAYVPSLDLFLDGTVEYAAPGELPPDDQGAIAFTLSAAGKLTRRVVPFTPPEISRVTREVKAQLSPKGRVHFVSQTHFQGYFAAVERRTNQSPDLSNDLAGSSQAALARFYPTVRIAHAAAEGIARASREVQLEVEGDIDATASPAADRPLGDRPGVAQESVAQESIEQESVAQERPLQERQAALRSSLRTTALTSNYAPQSVRQNPLLIPATPSEHELFDYQLPPGAQPNIPSATRLLSPFGRVEISYRLERDSLRVETYTELTPLTVQPADYPAFRAFCEAADQALQRQVTILLPQP